MFPASTLGKETDINQALSLGTVDIIYTGMAFAGRTYPPMSIASGPVHLPRLRPLAGLPRRARCSGGGAGLRGQERPTSIAGYTYYGQRHLTANKMVQKPEDMKGMKLRVPDAPLFVMFPRAVGANPTPIAFAEVYLALQNGTVDAQENPLPTIDAKKFYEVQKYIVLTGHITESLVTIVGAATPGRKLLGRRPQDLRRRAVGSLDARHEGHRRGRERLVTDFEKRGKTVVKVDRGPFIQAVQKAVTAPDAPWPKDLYDRVQAIK